jgi:hypothetical protein
VRFVGQPLPYHRTERNPSSDSRRSLAGYLPVVLPPSAHLTASPVLLTSLREVRTGGAARSAQVAPGDALARAPGATHLPPGGHSWAYLPDPLRVWPRGMVHFQSILAHAPRRTAGRLENH